jgi:uncharacterized protein YegP (UPF0339 family)
MKLERYYHLVSQTTNDQNAMQNYFKTSDIKIQKDSAGCFTAKHKYQGILIDGNFYNSHQECRKEAVEVLKAKKSD